MRHITLFAALVSVAGCAGIGPEPYTVSPGQPAARLRIVTQMPDRTLVLLAQGMSCPASGWGDLTNVGDRTLAYFRTGLAQKHGRLDMPDGTRWQKGAFAESYVEADKPIYIRAHHFYLRHCFAVGRIRLRAGRDYELLFSRTASDEGWNCEISVAELKVDGKGVSRVAESFLEGPRNCEIGR
jgi:hypothetical protein